MADTEEEAKAKVKKAEKLRHWKNELSQADKRFAKSFHPSAERAVQRYVDEPNEAATEPALQAPKRLALFHSNVDTLRANLFAQIPEAEADRRFFDPKDDVSRVAAEMVTRVINNDLNDPQDQSSEVLKAALQDKLIAGLGLARFRYVMEEEDDPSVTPETLAAEYADKGGVPDDYEVPRVKKNEHCQPVYTYWKDVRWGPCRIWQPGWVGFAVYMTKAEVAKRFDKKGGTKFSDLIPFGTARENNNPTPSLFSDYDDNKRVDPEAEIWEIYDKDGKETLWVCKGFDQFLDEKDDILELPGFYPTPRPLIANTTSSKFLPKPDYAINEGLYTEIDELETRISYLTRATKVVGVYDSANESIKRIMQESCENELVPATNWTIFAERGGLKGAVDWMPIEQVVNALKVCVEQQMQRIEHLYQVTGLSDIIRGQASSPGTTAAEQKIKAQFASVRLQFQQDEFAQYVSDLMNIKVAIIRNLYDAERIIKLSNIMATPDAKFAAEAVKLIKDKDSFNIRVVIKAESLIQKNMAAIKGERTEMLQGIAQFFGMIEPMIARMPESAPYLMQILQYVLASFQGANEMEGLLDEFVKKIEEKIAATAANPPPNPEVEKEKAKAAGAAQIEQIKATAAVQVAQGEGQAQIAIKQAEGQVEVQVEEQKAQIELQAETLRIAAEERSKEADRMLEREKIAAENMRAEAKIASDEKIALAELASKEQLEREKIASAEKQADKAAAATVAAAKEKPAGGIGA